MYSHTHTYVHAYIHTYIHMCTCVCVYCMRAFTHACMPECITYPFRCSFVLHSLLIFIHMHPYAYLHPCIHARIHTCPVLYGLAVRLCGAGQAAARTPHAGEDSLSVQALGFPELYIFGLGTEAYDFSPMVHDMPAAISALVLLVGFTCSSCRLYMLFLRQYESVLFVTVTPCMPACT